jgi:outer membrane protein assembly factor BamA
VFALLLLLAALPDPTCGQQPVIATDLEGLPVESISIEGLQNLDEDVVRRRLSLQVGQPYTDAAARRDERAVSSLAIFWSIRIVAEAVSGNQPPSAVAVRVVLDQRFAWFAVPQVDWTEAEGWSYGFFGGHLNLFRRGHRLFATAFTGGRRYLSLSLSNPWTGPHHESFQVGGGVIRARNRLYDFEESGERITGEIGRWFGRIGRLGAGLRYQRVQSDRPGITLSSPNGDRLHMAWMTLGIDTTDPWAYPRLGLIARLTLEADGAMLGGDLDGSAAGGRAIWYAPLGHEVVFAASAMAEARYGDVPFWRLLTVGGPNTVRGYPLGHYLVRRRWDLTTELQWYAVPMRTRDLGALGEQILGISLSLFADTGAGANVAQGPGAGPLPADTPTLFSWGLGTTFHNAMLGTIRLEVAWPDRGGRRVIFRLGHKL